MSGIRHVNRNDGIVMRGGGPAFPLSVEGETDVYPGMSLRDYFAAAALMNIGGDGLSVTDVARTAYAIADAMLAERSK